MPQERHSDAVRFSVLRDRDGQVTLCYVSELNYLPQDHAGAHHEVHAEVRGKRVPMRVSPMPFAPHHYKR